jgi:prepilin-type N-terminal cleavage/methylation domain-containing protein
MYRKLQYRPFHPSQTGMSLLEVMIALAILLVASVGIMTMGTIAMSTTENQGHLAARTTEYAQDKMEQLNSLSWGDTTTDTTAFPPVSTGGTGLTVGGSSDPNSPVTTPGTGYVDYLDISGQPSTSTGNWYYIRVWQISNPATSSTCVVNGTSVPCLKQITVTAKVKAQVGAPAGALPQSTLTALKSSPF